MMQVALVLVVLGHGYSERKLRGEKHRANGYPGAKHYFRIPLL